MVSHTSSVVVKGKGTVMIVILGVVTHGMAVK